MYVNDDVATPTYVYRLMICQTSQRDVMVGRKMDRKEPVEYKLTKYS
jgi:hypothetical protein